jgi:hypothetical protein
MLRAMANEAEAERECRANIVAAEGDSAGHQNDRWGRGT